MFADLTNVEATTQHLPEELGPGEERGLLPPGVLSMSLPALRKASGSGQEPHLLICPLQHLAGRAVTNGLHEIEKPGIEQAGDRSRKEQPCMKNGPFCPFQTAGKQSPDWWSSLLRTEFQLRYFISLQGL